MFRHEYGNSAKEYEGHEIVGKLRERVEKLQEERGKPNETVGKLYQRTIHLHAK
jgi:hypothetical protein